MSAGESRDRGGIQVLRRAAAIVRVLAEEPTGASLSQLAAAVELPRSTVQRIIGALVEEGWVVPASASGGFRLGPALTAIAVVAAPRRHIETLAPYLRTLSAALDETVNLAVLEHDHVVFVDQVEAPRRLRVASSVGSTLPAHCTANGKALLACLPEARITTMLGERLARFTPHTITSRAELLAELVEVRRTGVGFDREELAEDICAIGRAVRAPDGWTAAITVPLPATRFVGNEDALVRALVETCAQAERALAEDAGR